MTSFVVDEWREGKRRTDYDVGESSIVSLSTHLPRPAADMDRRNP